jgi:hypothetical protein
MAEMSTPENEALVSRVYTQALQDRAEGRRLGGPEQLLYEVEMLSQELNSGASLEQYFRWASPEEIGCAAARLEQLGQHEAARLTRDAVATAFPGGLPASEADMDWLTDWLPEQEARLQALADAFTEFNGAITNALAGFYRRSVGEPA